MTDETAFVATFGWIEYYAAPELEGSGTLFWINLYDLHKCTNAFDWWSISIHYFETFKAAEKSQQI